MSSMSKIKAQLPVQSVQPQHGLLITVHNNNCAKGSFASDL